MANDANRLVLAMTPLLMANFDLNTTHYMKMQLVYKEVAKILLLDQCLHFVMINELCVQ